MTEDGPYRGRGETVDVIDDRFEEHDPTAAGARPERRYRDAEWLYQQYHGLRRSIREIAALCDVWPKTILRWLDKHGIETRPPGRSRLDRGGQPWRDEAWLREQYRDRGKTIERIASEQACSERTIRNWLHEHGIPTRSHGDRHPASRDPQPYRDADWLRTQYEERGRSADAIASDLDVNPGTIYRWLDRHGIETRSMAESRRLTEARPAHGRPDDHDGSRSPGVRAADERGRVGIDASFSSDLGDAGADRRLSPYRDEGWLREHYPEHSTTELAAWCNVTPKTICYWMDKYGIERDAGNPDAPYRDPDWLRAAYDDLGTITAVAEACGVTPGAIRYWMVEHGIERGPDATSGAYDGGRPEKSLADLIRAIRRVYERTGEWPSTAAYTEHRGTIRDAPSVSWFYDTKPEGLASWQEAVELARQRYED